MTPAELAAIKERDAALGDLTGMSYLIAEDRRDLLAEVDRLRAEVRYYRSRLEDLSAALDALEALP